MSESEGNLDALDGVAILEEMTFLGLILWTEVALILC
jgi:hypothetical protein